jgi:hypothetical protein
MDSRCIGKKRLVREVIPTLNLLESNSSSLHDHRKAGPDICINRSSLEFHGCYTLASCRRGSDEQLLANGRLPTSCTEAPRAALHRPGSGDSGSCIIIDSIRDGPGGSEILVIVSGSDAGCITGGGIKLARMRVIDTIAK